APRLEHGIAADKRVRGDLSRPRAGWSDRPGGRDPRDVLRRRRDARHRRGLRLAIRARAFLAAVDREATRLHRNGGDRSTLTDPDAFDGDALAGAVELGHRLSDP